MKPLHLCAVLSLLLGQAGCVSVSRDELNVRTFGAVGDGTIRDTAAFQKALDICSAAKGGEVVVPVGNYLIGSIELKSYTNRERQGLGSARPSPWLIGSSVADVLIASTLAACGIAMAPLPLPIVGSMLVAAVVFAFILDVAKVPVFRRLRIG
jgi:hypothetical protein